jgi:hypothetical protein
MVTNSSHVCRMRENETIHPNCIPSMGTYLPKKYKHQGFLSHPNPYLFIGETSFWYWNYSCLWNFCLFRKSIRVPTLWKNLCTLHFAKAWKISILAQQITWRHDRNSNKWTENNLGIVRRFVISKKLSSFQITFNSVEITISIVRVSSRHHGLGGGYLWSGGNNDLREHTYWS